MDREGQTEKRIIVYSAIDAQYFTSDVPWACISIATEPDFWPPISDDNRLGLLRLAFADIRYPEHGELGSHFNNEHAHAVLDFIEEHWHSIDVLMIHCEAGTSRSPAVAAVISRIYVGDDGGFTLPHLYQPNPHVYRTLLEVASERGEHAG